MAEDVEIESGRRMLIVEDDPFLQELYSVFFKGYNHTLVGSVSEAVQALEVSRAEINPIIC